MALRATAARALEKAAEEGGIIVQIVWRPEVKKWRVVASVHTGSRVQAMTVDVDHTGAPGVDDLRRLVTSIQRECESWLW